MITVISENDIFWPGTKIIDLNLLNCSYRRGVSKATDAKPP